MYTYIWRTISNIHISNLTLRCQYRIIRNIENVLSNSTLEIIEYQINTHNYVLLFVIYSTLFSKSLHVQ